MTDKRIVLTTTGSEEEARKIAKHLVEHRLAACVNIVSRVISVYRWQGKLEEADEWLLMVKTTEKAFPSVCQAIKKQHSYELPECICVNVEEGSSTYMQWISDSVTPGK